MLDHLLVILIMQQTSIYIIIIFIMVALRHQFAIFTISSISMKTIASSTALSTDFAIFVCNTLENKK